MLEPYTARGLKTAPRVAHGFFTKAGGVSDGIYATLNCGLGSKDDAAQVCIVLPANSGPLSVRITLGSPGSVLIWSSTLVT